jgi:Leucine-rich repeat (LRR) protein
VNYQVVIGGIGWDESADSLEIKDPDADELTRQIPYLKKLTYVHLSGQLPEAEALFRLRDAFPHIRFIWEVQAGTLITDCTAETLDLSGIALTYDEALRILSLLPDLKEADMRGCGLTDAEMMALADSFPGCFLLWEMEAFGLTFSTDVTELDISGFKMDSPEPIEQLLPYLKKLEKVYMSHCGLDDETMDALNKRYPSVRFVWSVYIKGFYIPTDSVYFYPYKLNTELYLSTQDLYPLRYCTDLICIDIGHQTAVHNCDWAAYMPELQYLIIAHTSITDLSPLVNCKKLKYLEIFLLDLKDYSPLVELTALEDLNMGCTYADPAPIAKMTWLKNLWWFDAYAYGKPCSGAEELLAVALPNTVQKYHIEHSTAGGWRKLDGYFEMRDIMGMFYLK